MDKGDIGAMASIETRNLRDGRKRIIVRWREAGRGSKYRSKSFPGTKQGRKDAAFFAASVERGKQLGQMAAELVGSEQTVEAFIVEWWNRYAIPRLAPNTRTSYEYVLDKWVVPYLGQLRLRDVTREVLDEWMAAIRKAGAGAPTANRALAIVQGVLRRAAEWRRLAANPAAHVSKLKHSRTGEIRARTPEEVEAVRARLGRQDAALVSVLAYVGLRPAEAFALRWRDVLDARGRPRGRVWAEGTKTARSRRSPELFAPVGRELLELYVAAGRPSLASLVFANADGGPLSRQNWRQRVWKPALDGPRTPGAIPPRRTSRPRGSEPGPIAGRQQDSLSPIPYFRPYDLRHTCATLLIYEGRTPGEVAAHLGHADPGFTLKTYTHVFTDAAKRRRVTITDAITTARASARREKRA